MGEILTVLPLPVRMGMVFKKALPCPEVPFSTMPYCPMNVSLKGTNSVAIPMLTTHIALGVHPLVIFTLPLPPTFSPSAFSSPPCFTCKSMFLASVIAAGLVGLLLLQAVQEKTSR